ncbi:hypothetical protein C2S51_003418 [Perilla frutescens var. frutescens]|nr:hypothetical protein C2S51_003418 [Perilla frutescens var. frutescens]
MSSKNSASAISKFFSTCSCKPNTSAVAFRDYCRLVVPCFNFGILDLQNRSFSAKPRFDFGRLRDPDDAIALFHEMVRTRDPIPSVVDFNKLMSAVVKMKQYSVALYLFDEMLQRNARVDHYTLGIAMECFCRLKRVDYGFAIMGIQIKGGYEPPDVVTFTNLIKGLFLVGKVSEAGKLYNKLLREKLCEPNEVTYLIVINGLCKAGHTLPAE